MVVFTRHVGKESEKNEELHLCLNNVGFTTVECWIYSHLYQMVFYSYQMDQFALDYFLIGGL